MATRVKPHYASIESIRDIIEPWIELHGGDEWGESMRDLHGAAKTSYGFSDEDCALFAEKLLENLELLVEYDGVGGPYERDPVDIEQARKEAREAREYWRGGGNIASYADVAIETIDSLPTWLFEGEDVKACDHDWRIMPNVIVPANPPQQRLVCASCGAQDTRPHPAAGLPSKDPKDWEKA